LVAYKTLQFFCRKGFKTGPMMPRTIQTIASDMYAALKNAKYFHYNRTLVSNKDIIMFRRYQDVDASYLDECYKAIRRKGEGNE